MNEGLDLVAFDEEPEAVAQTARCPVEQPKIREQDGMRRRPGLRPRVRKKPKRCNRRRQSGNEAAPRERRLYPARERLQFGLVAKATGMTVAYAAI